MYLCPRIIIHEKNNGMSWKFKQVLLTIVMGAALFSCKQKEVFKVEGSIGSAEGDTLYLEHRGLAGIVVLDSVVLKGDGRFSLKQPAPANPEFYQFRLGDQLAVFAVDSAETLRVTADATDLYHSLTKIRPPTTECGRWTR